MARTPYVDPAQYSDQYRAALVGKPPLNLYRMLPRTGALAPLFLKMGAAIREQLSLPARLRELAIVRTGMLCGANYEVHHHSELARRAGVTDAELALIAAGDLASLPSADQLVLRYTEALVSEVRADDALFDALSSAIGVDCVAELTMTIGFYLLVCRFLRNFDIDIETDFQHSTWS